MLFDLLNRKLGDDFDPMEFPDTPVTGGILILERMTFAFVPQFSVYSFHGIRSTGTAARRSFRSSSP